MGNKASASIRFDDSQVNSLADAIQLQADRELLADLILQLDTPVLRAARAADTGDSLLHVAVRSACFAGVELLLKAGCDVDAINAGGETPVHLAAAADDFEEVLAELLEEGGANIGVRNHAGDTPLHVAVRLSHPVAARMLLDSATSAELLMADGSGKALSDIAAAVGHPGILQMVKSHLSKTSTADGAGGVPQKASSSKAAGGGEPEDERLVFVSRRDVDAAIRKAASLHERGKSDLAVSQLTRCVNGLAEQRESGPSLAADWVPDALISVLLARAELLMLLDRRPEAETDCLTAIQQAYIDTSIVSSLSVLARVLVHPGEISADCDAAAAAAAAETAASPAADITGIEWNRAHAALQASELLADSARAAGVEMKSAGAAHNNLKQQLDIARIAVFSSPATAHAPLELAAQLETYYDMLLVEADASDEDIKAAYRSLCKVAHPDKYGFAAPKHLARISARFQSLTKAAEVLADPLKRTMYDRMVRDYKEKGKSMAALHAIFDRFVAYTADLRPDADDADGNAGTI